MARLKKKNGLTLIELILAMAILGIIAVAFTSVFGASLTGIFISGHRTGGNMQLQAVFDDLNAQPSSVFKDNTTVKAYLDGKGYNQVASEGSLPVKVPGKNINYYFSAKNVAIQDPHASGTDIPGYEITILRFFDNADRYTKATAFIAQGGG